MLRIDKLLLFIGAALTPAFVQAAAASNGFVFHSQVPIEERRLLSEDLHFLESFPLTTAPEFARLAELPAVDGPSTRAWILERSRYIVPSSFRWDGPKLMDLGAQAYPNPNFVAQTASSGANVVTGAVIGMTNIGDVIYLEGKRIGRRLGVQFDGQVLPITSPRVGLLQIGAGLFGEETKSRVGALDSSPSRLLRIATLIHESRHSDGHGATTGFIHAACPPGHRYAGRQACDLAANGPYAVEAAFLFSAADACLSRDCTVEKRELMRAYALDYASRVQTLSEGEANADRGARLAMTERLLLNAKKMATVPDETRRAAALKEIRSLTQKRDDIRAGLALTSLSKDFWPSKPEGISLETSK